jgi:hypothetical protein
VRSLVLIAGLAALAPASARADMIRSLFGPDSASGCFTRTYDAAHLKRHPGQKVRQIIFDYQPETSAEARKTTGPRTFGVAVKFRSKADGDGGAVAYCRNAGDRVSCYAEGDAGSFDVTRAGPDRIRIRMTRGLGFENDSKKGHISLEDSPDDRVFVLGKAPLKACDILR